MFGNCSRFRDPELELLSVSEALSKSLEFVVEFLVDDFRFMVSRLSLSGIPFTNHSTAQKCS